MRTAQGVPSLFFAGIPLIAQSLLFTASPVNGIHTNTVRLEAKTTGIPLRVTFFDGASPIGTSAADSHGTAELAAHLSAGRHVLRAVEWGTGRVLGDPRTIVVPTSPSSSLGVVQQISLGLTPMAISTARIFGDDPADVAAIDDQQIAILRNSSGVLGSPVYFKGVARQIGFALSDFDGDGRTEIAVASSDGLIAVWHNQGSGDFAPVRPWTAARNISALAVGDFNQDGIPDLAAASPGEHAILLFYGNGDGTFRAGARLAIGGFPRAMVVGDFNADGIADLAVADSARNEVVVFLSTGNGFRSAERFSAGNGASTLATGDWNQDGVPDLAVWNKVDRSVSVLQGIGDGNFRLAETILGVLALGGSSDGLATAGMDGVVRFAGLHAQSGGMPSALSVADLDGDGIPEFIEADASGTLYVLGQGISGQTVHQDAGAASAGNALPQAVVEPMVNSYTLGTTSLTVGPAAGSSSVELIGSGAWTATANASWLHLSAGSTSGNGGQIVVFTYDANTGGTQTGTITINGSVTLTVTQAGSGYVAANTVVPLVATGAPVPGYIAVDATGNVNLTDFLNVAIKKWNAATQQVSTLPTPGLIHPYAAIADAAGNLYIESRDDNNNYNYVIQKWTAATQQVTTLVSSGLTFPGSIALDSTGNLYFCDYTSGLKMWSASTQQVTTLSPPGVALAAGVAVDSLGNLFIADRTNQTLVKWNPASQQVATLASGLMFVQGAPIGVAADGSGNVYLVGTADNVIKRWNASTQQMETMNTAKTLQFPAAVAVNGSENLYFVDGTYQVQMLPTLFVNPTALSEPAGAGSDSLPPVIPASIPLTGVFAPAVDQTWMTFGNIANGTVSFSFTPNPAPLPRAAHITLLGQRITVNQAAPQLALGTNSLLLGPGAGTASVMLAANVAWSANTDAAWLHLAAGSLSGTSSQTIFFTYDANSGATRSGTITVNGATLTATQAGSGYVPANPLTNLVSGSGSTVYGVAGTAVDLSGNVYFVDPVLGYVNEWSASTQQVTQVIGFGTTLLQPHGIAVDGYGDLFIADTGHNQIQMWNAATQQSSVVVSSLLAPQGVAVDSAGNLYIADTGHGAIEEWNPSTRQLATLVPNLSGPQGVAVDAAGNVYFSEAGHNAIKEWIAATQQVTTLVSTGLSSPSAVALDGSGNLYIADTADNAIKLWNAATQQVSVLPSPGLTSPVGVAVDRSGNLYATGTVFVFGNPDYRVVKIAPVFVSGVGRTEPATAGADSLPPITPVSTSLSGTFAPTSDQAWLTITGVNNGIVSFSFSANSALSSRVAHINALGQSIAITQNQAAFSAAVSSLTVTPAAGSSSLVLAASVAWTASAGASWIHLTSGSSSGPGSQTVQFTYDANSGPTRTGSISFNGGTFTVAVIQAGSGYVASNYSRLLINGGVAAGSGLAVTGSDVLYLSDNYHYVYQWDPSNPAVTNFVAVGSLPAGLAIDSSGNVYFADTQSNSVNVWSPVTQQTTALVSSGLNGPTGVAVDASGTVYIADAGNKMVKKWSAATRQVTTLVSSGLTNPVAIAVDAAANVYIADVGAGAVLVWNPATLQLTTLSTPGLSRPVSVAVDGSGNIYVADNANNAIYKWTAATQQFAVAWPAVSQLSAITVDNYGNLYEMGGGQLQVLAATLLAPAGITEPPAAGSDVLTLLPPSPILASSLFAATSNQNWLTIGSTVNGVVNFSFTANATGSTRGAQMKVLGQNLSITQLSGSPQLIFSSQPGSVSAGHVMPAIQVQLLDANGNLMAGSSTAVTLTSSPAGINTTVNAVNGVATFNSLALGSPGTYTLTASSAGLTSAVSNSFLVASSNVIFVSGNVTVSGVGLSGVTINVTGIYNTSTTTDSAGHYNISLVAGNTYTLSAVLAGYSFSAPVTVVNPTSNQSANFTGTKVQNQVSRAVFRDTHGAIQMTTYPSSTLSYAGGVFASDPSIAEDAGGNVFVTARDTFNSIWANVYNSGSSTWANWSFGGGIIQGVPSIAVDTTGKGWIASRDTYNSYWLVSYSSATGFGTWLPLLGIFSTDPLITGCSDGSVYLIGKDNFNSLWSGHYIPGTGFQGWQFGGGIIKGKPSAACGSDSAVYVAAEDNFNSNWMARVSGNSWTGWYYGGAITSVTPRIASLANGTQAVVILDSTNVVWRTTFTEGAGNGWQPWTQVGGILQDVAPAAVDGQLYLSGKAPNGDLWWWLQSGNQWTWIGNNGVASGLLSAGPR